MAGDLVPQAPMLPGLLPNAEADQITSFFLSGLVLNEGPPALPRLPNADERKVLGRRREDLYRANRPISESMTDRDKAKDRLAIFCYGWSSNRGQGVDAEVLVSTMVHDLADLPLFAILQACDDIVRGRVRVPDGRGGEKSLDPTFPVSSAQVYAVADKIASASRREEHRIRQVLDVRRVLTPPLSEDKRQKIHEGLRDLANQLRSNLPPEVNPETVEKVAEWRAEHNTESQLKGYQRMGVDPIYATGDMLVSPQLAKKLGAIREPERQSYDRSRQYDQSGEDENR